MKLPRYSSTTPRHLLIDGDIIAFISAAASQDTMIDDDGYAQPFASVAAAEVAVENMLFNLKTGLKAQGFTVYLSDPNSNWRSQVDPTYKTNRTGPRPLLLDRMKQYLRDKHGATHWEGLEADDVLGIRATEPPYDADTSYIVVGRDKDFKSIPGKHHAWKQDVDAKGGMVVREVTQWEGDRFHLIQTLAGDAVDGYHGCPGIGMTRAAAIIDKPVRLVPQPGVKTRGVNKGDAVVKWVAEPTRDYWACIVSHYWKGMTAIQQVTWDEAEELALTTARLARILRYGEYDRATASVTLWTPAMLKGVGR